MELHDGRGWTYDASKVNAPPRYVQILPKLCRERRCEIGNAWTRDVVELGRAMGWITWKQKKASSFQTLTSRIIAFTGIRLRSSRTSLSSTRRQYDPSRTCRILVERHAKRGGFPNHEYSPIPKYYFYTKYIPNRFLIGYNNYNK